MLSNEISQKFLVDPCGVDDLFLTYQLPASLTCFFDFESVPLYSDRVNGVNTYSSIPERTAKLNSFQENRLSLCWCQIGAETETEAHGSETWSRDSYVSEWECLDHVCGIECGWEGSLLEQVLGRFERVVLCSLSEYGYYGLLLSGKGSPLIYHPAILVLKEPQLQASTSRRLKSGDNA